jgi:hypothetical protein
MRTLPPSLKLSRCAADAHEANRSLLADPDDARSSSGSVSGFGSDDSSQGVSGRRLHTISAAPASAGPPTVGAGYEPPTQPPIAYAADEADGLGEADADTPSEVRLGALPPLVGAQFAEGVHISVGDSTGGSPRYTDIPAGALPDPLPPPVCSARWLCFARVALLPASAHALVTLSGTEAADDSMPSASDTTPASRKPKGRGPAPSPKGKHAAARSASEANVGIAEFWKKTEAGEALHSPAAARSPAEEGP